MGLPCFVLLSLSVCLLRIAVEFYVMVGFSRSLILLLSAPSFAFDMPSFLVVLVFMVVFASSV